MDLQGARDKIKCRAFSLTLIGPASTWFRKLKSIASFWELTQAFLTQFIGGQE